MFWILNAKFQADIEYWLVSKLQLDYVKQLGSGTLGSNWDSIRLSNLTELAAVLQPQEDLFGSDSAENLKPKLIVIDQPISFNSEEVQLLLDIITNPGKSDVYLYFNQIELGATVKKILLKADMEFIDIGSIPNKTKENIATGYVSESYPTQAKQLNRQVLEFLQNLDLPEQIISHIDFWNLAEIASWAEYIQSQENHSTPIFKMGFARSSTVSSLKTVFEHGLNPAENQLLLTILSSRLIHKEPILLQKLVNTDYQAKTRTKVSSTIWLKKWLYDAWYHWR